MRPDQASVYGVISLVFWAVTLIVSIKYVTLIMRADNHGEGGIMALIALVRGVRVQRRIGKLALVSLGIFGASLFYGDGMITPAISVLSAVEGIEVAAPGVEVARRTDHARDPHRAVRRPALRHLGGRPRVRPRDDGVVRDPRGLRARARDRPPGILRALAPTYAAQFLFDHGSAAFLALGAVVLTVTGAEALYADMGHFGRSAIRRAWFAVVFPALILNYMGQGALILEDPKAVDNPFFLLFPRLGAGADGGGRHRGGDHRLPGGHLRRVLGHPPGRAARLPAAADRPPHRHARSARSTCRSSTGAIFTAVAALVIGFGSSDHLAAAYGIAVTGTLAIDTLLFFFVVRALWHRPLWLALAGGAFFLVIDLAFFGANLPKVLHGGWFPLVVAVIIFTVLVTWQNGREIVTKRRRELEGPL